MMGLAGHTPWGPDGWSPFPSAKDRRASVRRGDQGFHTAEVKNGCKHHADCFTCPFDDCIVSVTPPTAEAKAAAFKCPLCGEAVGHRGSLVIHLRHKHGHGFEHLAASAAAE